MSRPTRVEVILSLGPTNNPIKRGLETAVAESLAVQSNIRFQVVPHLNDLTPHSSATHELQQLAGDLIVLSWLYPRASYWLLHVHGIRGLMPATSPTESFDPENDTRQEQLQSLVSSSAVDERRDEARTVYCLDLKQHSTPAACLAEIKRILCEATERADWSVRSTSIEPTPARHSGLPDALHSVDGVPRQVAAPLPSRWYPIIDYSRCTNCMECIDFCLFGVYGVDAAENILVEQPDQCRKGCPACSRVCPENAIIFPQHKSPAIAGADGDVGALKLDLSQLFAGTSGAEENHQQALREREEQWRQAARDNQPRAGRVQSQDALDRLLDELDEFDK